MVPNGWGKMKLIRTCDFLDGKRRPIKYEDRQSMQGIYPYYGATGIIDHVNDYIFDEELILMGEDGENILSRVLPHVFVVKGKVWVNNHAHVLRPKNGNDIHYLAHYLESLDYRKFNTGSAQPKLNKKSCEKIPVLLPPLPEQKKIARILSTWDKAIETVDKLIENSQQQKKALMQQLLTGKKRLPGFSGEWKEGTLSKMASITMGQSPAGETYNTDGKGLPLLNGPTEFTERYPIKKQWTSSPTKVCNPGDVLLCVRGSSTGRMNMSDDTYCIGRGIAAISNNKNGAVEFIEHLLVRLTDIIVSMTSGSTFPNIDKKTLSSIGVSIPPLDEQKAIAKVLSANDRTTEGLEKLRNQYQFQKKALMQQLLTGKRRVQVTE